MADPFGAIHNQNIGDIGVFVGSGSWAASGQMPADIGVNITGPQAQIWSGWGGTGKGNRLYIIDGSTTNPAPNTRVTVLIARDSSNTTGTILNPTTMTVLNHVTSNVDQDGPSAGVFATTQYGGRGDAIGLEGQGTIDASAANTGVHNAIGVYGQAEDGPGTNNVVGFNSVSIVHDDKAYALPPNASAGLFAQALATPAGHAYRTGTGVLVYANTPADGLWDKGFVVAPTSAKTTGFGDYSDSTIAFEVTGSHTTGLDFSGATISGSQINLKAGVSYSPTPTPSGGAFTTVTAAGGYTILGKMLFIRVVITQTNVGTGAGDISFTLPLSKTANGTQQLGIIETDVTTIGPQAFVSTGSGTVTLRREDHSTSLINNGNFLVISGWIEVN